METFTTKIFSKIAISIVLFVVLNIVFSIYVEYNKYVEYQNDITLAARRAIDYTRVNLQATGEYSDLYALDPDDVKLWCQQVRGQLGGGNTAWLTKALETIEQSADSGMMFTPLNFGLTYINKEHFKEMFTDALMATIEANYGTNTTPPTSGTAWGTVLVDSINVDVVGPNVVPLQGSYLLNSIFGTTDLGYIDSGINQFPVVISYQLKVSINWSSVTTMPIFNNVPGFRQYTGPLTHLQNHAVISSGTPIVLMTNYVLTN